MNSTFFALMAEFGTGTVELKDICEKYFGLSEDQARRRAKVHKLPIPVFRPSKSQKAPMLVNLADLASHIDKMRELALEEFQSVNT